MRILKRLALQTSQDMNFRAYLNTLTNKAFTLPIVVLYVTEGCNLKCQMCSYRAPLPHELSLIEIEALADDLVKLGLRHIVFSGGEPLMRRDFPSISALFHERKVKSTLLTNGLLLEKRFPDLEKHLSEVIISLDGARAETHDVIRGVISFEKILGGIRSITDQGGRPYHVSIRSVLQKKNFREISEIVDLAEDLGVDKVSFLAADVLSDSFGRKERGRVAADESICLDAHEVREFRSIIEQIIDKYSGHFASDFITESPSKLIHIVEYFEALLGLREFPQNVCNAPMVSAVITASGDLQPCFFLPMYGNMRRTGIGEMINADTIQSTRQAVQQNSLERCKTCVCTLFVKPRSALFDKF